MIKELANIIDYISKKIALDAKKFKSRLIFKAVAEIFQREVKSRKLVSTQLKLTL